MGVAAELSRSEARFDAIRRRVGSVAAPVTFFLLLAIPIDGLSVPAQRLAAVSAMTVILWVTEAIPLPVAGLLGPALAVMLGVTDAKSALAPFADPLIFLFLGGFLLASGLAHQGSDRRAALWLMARPIIKGSPTRALVALGGIAYAFSMWISNTATTAMMIPVALGLHETMKRALDDPEHARRLDRFVGGMCLTVAYAANVGGIATPIGTGPNVIALSLLERSGVRFDFFEWMSFALPTSLLMFGLVTWQGVRRFRSPVDRIAGLTARVRRELAELGPLRSGETRVVVVFMLAVAGWLTPAVFKVAFGPGDPLTEWARGAFNEGVVAIVAASLLFLIPADRSGAKLVTWERAVQLDWGTLFLLGGGLALGRMAIDTGLAEAIGRGVLSFAGPIAAHPVGLLGAATLLVVFLTEVTSNTATISMMLPVLLGIAKASGTDPVPTALCVTMAGSLAFMLPVSTPPNAMAYGTRLVRVDTMVRVGLWLDFTGFAVLMLSGTLLLPLVLP